MTITFDEFTDTVKTQLPNWLPPAYRDCRIAIDKVTKESESYTSLSVTRSGNDLCPAVNLNMYYDRFLSGSGMDRIISAIAMEATRPAEGIPDDLSWLTDYETVKDRLFIKLSGNSNIENIKGNAPYRMFSDMVITYHILINNDGSDFAAAMITNNNITAYDITPEQLHKDAMENSPRILPGRVEPLESIISDLLPAGITQEDTGKSGLMVITNETGIDGASALLYPGVIENAAVYFEGSYYILPSSVHEIILMPESFHVDVNHINEMINQINEAMVAPEERLSSTAYRYDAQEGLFESLPEYKERIAAKRLDEWKQDAPKPAPTTDGHMKM